jgi:hypothetical protein
MINGVTAGPVLRKLGLADVSGVRKRMLHCYESHYREHAIEDLILLIARDNCMGVKFNFGIVQHHLSFYFSDLTKKEFMHVAKRHLQSHPEDRTNLHEQLKNILPYLKKGDGDDDEEENGNSEDKGDNDVEEVNVNKLSTSFARKLKRSPPFRGAKMFFHDCTLIEFRRVFLELVRSRYAVQIKMGEVLDKEFVTFSLTQSLDIAAEHVDKGPLNDWDFVGIVQLPWAEQAKNVRRRLRGLPCFKCMMGEAMDPAFLKRLNIEQCVLFIGAHNEAQKMVKEQFDEDADYSEVAKEVLQESAAEVDQALAKLTSFNSRDVEVIVSHKIVKALLNNVASYVEELAESGLLKEQEATQYLERIQETLNKIEVCDLDHHPGELPSEVDETAGGDVAKSKSIGTGILEVSQE